MVAFRNGVLLVQHRVDGPVDFFAVGDVHTAFFVDIDPQIPLAAFPDIFHIPQAAAVFFNDGLGKLGDKIRNFHLYLLSKNINKREGCPSLA